MYIYTELWTLARMEVAANNQLYPDNQITFLLVKTM